MLLFLQVTPQFPHSATSCVDGLRPLARAHSVAPVLNMLCVYECVLTHPKPAHACTYNLFSIKNAENPRGLKTGCIPVFFVILSRAASIKLLSGIHFDSNIRGTTHNQFSQFVHYQGLHVCLLLHFITVVSMEKCL